MLISRLHARRSGKGWIAKCPAHDDHTPSLSIDEGGDGRVLLKCHAGCDTDAVLSAIGLTKRDLFPATSHRHSNNGSTARISTPASTFDWQACVAALRPSDLVRLGNERWWSRAFCSWLRKGQRIGLFRGDFAFPVQNNGAIVGTHYRFGNVWPYFPSGIKTALFIVGSLAKAKQFHTGESPWDMLSLADRTDWYKNENMAFIATRGAGNAKLVKHMIPQGVSVCAWPQNDKAGEEWLAALCAHAGSKVAKAQVPPQYKDLNEWTKAGASAEDRYKAFWRNELVYEPQKPKPVDLAGLLEEVCAFLKRYVVFPLPAEQPLAIALWVAHTWALDAFDYTPYLYVASPEKQCGKTRLLDCLELLTPKPWRAILPSEAVLFRTIEKDRPTLLLDEIDGVFNNSKDERKEALRSLLNAGFEEKAKIPRCIGQGQNLDVKNFAVFCPKVLAGIGKLPDTVRDRCIPIQLVRRSRDERVEKFRKREAENEATAIRSELEGWSKLVGNLLRDSRPVIPDALSDRQQDICEPLLAIAELADGEWPERARTVFVTLCIEGDEDESIGVKLLSGIRDAFEAADADRLATKQLLEALVNQETDAPWASWWEHDLNNGNTRGPAQKLARLLKPYRVQARGIRLSDNTTLRGYIREDFEEAWKRYCPPKLPLGCNNAT
jgi:hypothetical protein